MQEKIHSLLRIIFSIFWNQYCVKLLAEYDIWLQLFLRNNFLVVKLHQMRWNDSSTFDFTLYQHTAVAGNEELI